MFYSFVKFIKKLWSKLDRKSQKCFCLFHSEIQNKKRSLEIGGPIQEISNAAPIMTKLFFNEMCTMHCNGGLDRAFAS